MSFASDVKEEVARLQLDEKTRKAQLCAIIKLLSSLKITSEGLSLTLKCKNAAVIRNVAQSLLALYDVRSDFSTIKEERFDRRSSYRLTVNEKARDILEDLDLWTGLGIQTHPRMRFLNNESMIRGYLSGCFLATGSINDPSNTSYHLEISCQEEEHAEFIIRLLQKFNITARKTSRRNQQMVYVKASEQITDFLRVIGASNAIFTFEDVRIQRDFVNSLSRLNNCEIANEAKSFSTAQKQAEAIRYLVESGHLAKLSDKDREIAMLRLEYDDTSLLELAGIYEEKTGVVLSKSGIRHRFNKIMELAEKYRSKEVQS